MIMLISVVYDYSILVICYFWIVDFFVVFFLDNECLICLLLMYILVI